MSEQRFEYRIHWTTERGETVGSWGDVPITAVELAEWREDLGGATVVAERRPITYGDAEIFEPTDEPA